ncbi:MAG: hypothetical protein AAF733_00670 [Verrucomicrobiota bacterium]
MKLDLLNELRRESTWRLFFLCLITLFVYPAHYIARQTKVINGHVDESEQIEAGFVWTIFAVSYLSMGLFIGYFFVEEDHPVAVASNISDRIQTFLFLFWAFAARKRINSATKAYKGSTEWFHGFWTFFFTYLYLNFKINSLTKADAGPAEGDTLRTSDTSFERHS